MDINSGTHATVKNLIKFVLDIIYYDFNISET